jgi:ligand-binding sensor domain-containing protein
LCSDHAGRIWIGTLGRGLNIYDPKTFTFTHLTDNITQDKIPPGNYITSLFLVDDVIWAGTKGGLRLFDTKGMRPAPLPAVDKSITSKEITQVNRDVAGNMWLATADREIIKLTRQREYYQVQKTLLRRNTLAEAEGNVLTLATDTESNVWIAGEFYQVCLYR